MATVVLRLRCFLEGIEVPIVAASQTVGYNAPAACQIQIPATDEAFRFHPRTLVHVFFLDPRPPSALRSVRSGEPEAVADVGLMPMPENLGDPPSNEEVTAGIEPDEADVLEVDSVDLGDQEPRRAAPLHVEHNANLRDMPAELELMGLPPELAEDPDVLDRRWKLFFCGEIIGFQYMKSQGQRAIVLQCLDPSVYWDTCYQYQVNVASLHGNATAHFVGAGTNLFDTFFSSPTETIVDVVRRRSVSRPELTGLLSGVVHLLERVGGVYTSHRGFKGVNDFFSLAELRLHLIDMIGASEDDTSSQRLFPRRAFNAWSRSAGGRLGQIASFREILNQLNRFIYHDTVPCPIARYQAPDEFERTRRVRTGTANVRFSGTPEGEEIFDQVFQQWRTLVTFSNYHGLIRVGGLSRQMENLTTAVVRSKDRVATHMSQYGLQSVHSDLHRAGQELRRLATLTRRFETMTTGGTLEAAVPRSPYTASGEYRPLPASSYREVLNGDGQAAYSEAHSRLQSASQALAQANRDVSTHGDRTETVTTSGRLYNQIIRPDIFMVAPPRCNVIFPELYNELQFSRQYLREITRLRLTVSDEIFGPNSLLDNIYFAPDVEVLGARVRQGRGSSGENSTLSRAAYAQRVMEHELYSGVIPVFERMNEVNLVAGRSNQVSVRGVAVPYAMRAADFQFFKSRWASRSVSVSGRFNPYMAPGFPAVVMDRYMTEEQVRLADLRGNALLDAARQRGWARVREELDDREETEEWQEFGLRSSYVEEGPSDAWLALRETVPTQFVGLVAQLTHNVSQDSASTSYALSSARTHRDTEELLGANVMSRRRQEAGTRTQNSTVAAPTDRPPQEGQIGPNRGTITAVSASNRTTGSYRLFGTFGSSRPQTYSVMVRVGIRQRAEAYGPEVVTLAGGDDVMLEFGAYDITESIDRTTERLVTIPIEDLLRPPWMSDVWSNEQIGSAYQQFFGTGSITDSIVMQTDEGFTMDSSEEADRDAEAETSAQAQDPIRADGATHQDAGIEITVERAIDLLVRTYSALRHNEMDVVEFVQAYTERPIANLVEMLGGRNLSINPETGEVTGTEGMHSRAFGHGENGRNLRNLVPRTDVSGRPIRQILGIDVREDEDVADNLRRLDKRADRADRVMEYVEKLWASKAQLG